MNRGKSKHRPRNAPHLYGGKYPFVQTGDISQSNGRITKHTQTYSEAGLAQRKLWPQGTICITIAANIASSAVLTYPACFPDPDSVVGILSDVFPPEYIEFFIRTARSELEQFAPATAQKNINIGILNKVVIPLAPIKDRTSPRSLTI
jgi:type I restriction enzyme S subunit